jgi:hypothetical protein
MPEVDGISDVRRPAHYRFVAPDFDDEWHNFIVVDNEEIVEIERQRIRTTANRMAASALYAGGNFCLGAASIVEQWAYSEAHGRTMLVFIELWRRPLEDELARWL